MKLTFFNKDNLDPVDIEQATITTTDANSDNITAIRNTDLKDTYKSALSNQTIKEVSIPFEYLEFYINGNESKGGFSKTNITSGDPQVIKEELTLGTDGSITASFTEQVDKNIPESLAGSNCILDRINAQQQFPTLREMATAGIFEIPLTQFETRLEVEIAGTVIPVLSNLLDRSFISTPLTRDPNTSERGLDVLKDYLQNGVVDFLSDQGSFSYSQITSSNYTRLDRLFTQASETVLPISENYTQTLSQDAVSQTPNSEGSINFPNVRRLSFDVDFTRQADVVKTFSKSGLQMKDRGVFAYFTKRELTLRNTQLRLATSNAYTDYINSFNSTLTFENSVVVTALRDERLSDTITIVYVRAVFNWSQVHPSLSGSLIAFSSSTYVPATQSRQTGINRAIVNLRALSFFSGFFVNNAYIVLAFRTITEAPNSISSQVASETQNTINLNSFTTISDFPDRENVPASFTNIPFDTEIRVNESTVQGLRTPSVFRFESERKNIINDENSRIDYGHVDVSTGQSFLFRNLHLFIQAGTERDFATANRILADNPIEFNFNNHDYSFTELTDFSRFPAGIGTGTLVTGNDSGPRESDPSFLLELLTLSSNIKGDFRNYGVEGNGDLIRLKGGLISRNGVVDNSSPYPINFNENLYSNRRLTFNDLRLANVTDFANVQKVLSLPREELTIQVIRAGGANFYDRPTPTDVLDQQRIARENYAMCLRDYAREIARRRAIPVSLISESPEFPFVSVNDIRFVPSNNKLLLYLSRKSRNAPAPSPLFFDNIVIDNNQFNFSDAVYSLITNNTNPVNINSNPFPSVDTSKYEWDSPSGDPTRALSVFNVIFNKTKAYKAGRFVVPRKIIRKSTIETVNKKTIAPVINGFKVSDFDFTSTSFSISFNQNINTNDFNCIRIYDKDGLVLLSRDLRYGDALRTNSENVVTFVWSDHPEFEILRNNKVYQIGIVTNASQTEGRYFIPRPAIADSDYPVSIIQKGRNLEFTLQSNRASSLAVRPFNSVYIKRENNTRIGKVFNIGDAIRNDDHFLLNNWKLQDTLPAFNTKYNLIFNVENFVNLDISFLKMVDFFFDTLVILNTNIEDISLKNSAGVELIHPSDIDSFKYVIEDNKRHIVLFLKNPISSQEIILRTNQTFKDEKQRLIGKVFLLRKIGCFSQYPFVKPMISSNRQSDKSLFNKTHVKSQIDSTDYNIEFPVLEKESDMLLAQDLFSRKSGYNEFVAWMSGGDLPEKITSVKGFRFQDLIKGLCVNEFEYEYQDGRFSSGGIFNMDIVEVI